MTRYITDVKKNAPTKTTLPVKITRSVGLQVNRPGALVNVYFVYTVIAMSFSSHLDIGFCLQLVSFKHNDTLFLIPGCTTEGSAVTPTTWSTWYIHGYLSPASTP